jgi:hypothetical protein
VSVNPIERQSIFDLSRLKPTVRATAGKWNFAFDKSLSRTTAVIDDGVIERLAKGKFPSHRSAWGVGVCPPKATVTRSNHVKGAPFRAVQKSIAEREGLPRCSNLVHAGTLWLEVGTGSRIGGIRLAGSNLDNQSDKRSHQ